MGVGDKCSEHFVTCNKSVVQVKKKWIDLKVIAKNGIAAHNRDVSATRGGQSTTSLSSSDDKIAAIIAETSLKGTKPERQP